MGTEPFRARRTSGLIMFSRIRCPLRPLPLPDYDAVESAAMPARGPVYRGFRARRTSR